MKTEHLAYFVDLAQSGALSKTAEKYYTSHQVIKKAISSLENELNVTLIQTSNQGVTLTPAGEILLPYARNVLALEQDVKDKLLPFTVETLRSTKRSIRFCITPYLTDNLILSFVNDYQTRNPEILFELLSLPFQDVLSRIDAPETVLVIPTIEDAVEEPVFLQALAKENLTYDVLAERPLYVAAHAKSKWARKTEPLTEDELGEMPVVVSSNVTLNTAFMGRLHHQMANSIDAQKKLIKMGSCVGLFTAAEYDYYFKKERGYVLLPTALQPVWYICVHQKDAELLPHVQDFLRQLADVF